MNASMPGSIEDELRALARSIEMPAPPDYAARVVAELAEQATGGGRPRRPASRPWRVNRLLVAAALVLIAGASAVVAVPATRHALASWFGFSGIDIRRAPHSLGPVPTEPAPLAAGRPVGLDRAVAATNGRLRLPASLEPPVRVYLRRDSGATVVTLAWLDAMSLPRTPDTGFALIMTEIFDSGSPVLEKIVFANARAARVSVGDRPGVFVSGPQGIINLDNGTTSHGEPVVHEVAPRSSANTLIWADGPATYRLEGDFTRAEALALGRAVP